jgi:hypothetical protein
MKALTKPCRMQQLVSGGRLFALVVVVVMVLLLLAVVL